MIRFIECSIAFGDNVALLPTVLNVSYIRAVRRDDASPEKARVILDGYEERGCLTDADYTTVASILTGASM